MENSSQFSSHFHIIMQSCVGYRLARTHNQRLMKICVRSSSSLLLMKNTFFMWKDRKAMKSIINAVEDNNFFLLRFLSFLLFAVDGNFCFDPFLVGQNPEICLVSLRELMMTDIFCSTLINFPSFSVDCAKHFPSKWIRDCFLSNPFFSCSIHPLRLWFILSIWSF